MSWTATGGGSRPSLLWRTRDELKSLIVLARAGFIGPETPRRFLRILRTLHEYGPFGAAGRIAAIRHGDQPAISDEIGEITFGEMEEQTNRLTNAFAARGLDSGSTIGILCRNHRMPLIAAFAASRAGVTAVWLNTAFSVRQAREVIEREGVELLVHDAEFTGLAESIELKFGRMVCFAENGDGTGIESAISAASAELPPPPQKPGRIVLLTSGTTGTPKGAPRPEPRSLTIPGALLERMPMRSREATVIGAPVYHGTGLVLALISIALGSKIVLRRQFDAATFLSDIEHHRAGTVCVVPVMLQRVLALGDDEIERRDLGSLRVVFCAGSQLPGTVARRAMDRLGDVIYNLYGSTEVSVATLATPADLRSAPTCVGRPALGSRVRVLDERGEPVEPGRIGRIYVGTSSPFEGYTGGGGKDMVDGLLSSGDLGHFDAEGRLFIDGRDDEMIVSGGENVYPHEVEETLMRHPALADVAVVGVEDEEFGQRLRAFVVLAAGQDATEAAVKQFVRANLATYKAPREVVFLDDLPRNPTGKILKRELPGQGESGGFS
ncbi:MAG TPA: AMP-binding protein [Solirubrobacterales bacterium]|nr:AMP-binding protein [Solirubrobacterales bacterium]